MSDNAVHCPHCGEAYPGRDVRVAPIAPDLPAKPIRGVTSHEAAALLAVSGADTRRPSFWKDYLLPDTRLATPLFMLDLALVVATLPLLAGILATLVMGRSRDRKATYTGSWWEKLVIGVLGGAVILASSLFYDWFATAVVVVLIAWVALAARAVLRARVDRADEW